MPGIVISPDRWQEGTNALLANPTGIIPYCFGTIKRNSIKMYDKDSVLRIETAINNPSEFKVCFQSDNSKWGSLRARGLQKGITVLK